MDKMITDGNVHTGYSNSTLNLENDGVTQTAKSAGRLVSLHSIILLAMSSCERN